MGFTIEDVVKFAKLAEGYIDILQLRAGDGDLAHPTGFNSKPHDPLTLRYAEAIKKSGAKIVTAPSAASRILTILNATLPRAGRT